MKPEDVPLGDRILPSDKCDICGGNLIVLSEAGDEENTTFIGCENIDSPTKDGEHTEFRGVPKKDLIVWGWNL